MERFQKHISQWEKTVAVILYLMLLLTIVTQLFFGGEVLLLMGVFAACALIFSWLVFEPEIYELQENHLVVIRGKRCFEIPYEWIIVIDTLGSFRGLKRDIDSTEVVLKYKLEGTEKKKSISCHPKNVMRFAKLLREKCPSLDTELD